jgi:hypothetical protein
MDATWLYYALSTIAQCAAALAALIGFLGLWKLDGLRREQEQVKQYLQQLLVPTFTNDDKARMDDPAFLVQAAEQLLAGNRAIYVQDVGYVGGVEHLQPMVRGALARWNALPGEQWRLMDVLQRFLRRMLIILALAIIGLAVANALNAWVLTRWLLRLLIIIAGYRLGRDTYVVVREAARSTPTLMILVFLLLLLTSPALAGPMHRATYEEKTLGRLHTVCDDGTRAVSTYNKTLGRVGHDHYQKHAISFIPLGIKVYGLQWSIRQISAISWNR